MRRGAPLNPVLLGWGIYFHAAEELPHPIGKDLVGHLAGRECLCSCDALILEYPDHDSTALRLSFSRLVAADLVALAHCPGPATTSSLPARAASERSS